MESKDLLSKLDGTPAQVLVVLGFMLALLAPLIPYVEFAGAASAKAEYDEAVALVDLDLEKLKREQEAAAGEATADVTFYTQMQAREAELKKAMDKKREGLEKTYRVHDLKREMIEAQADALGTVCHVWLGWLGRLFLIIGLLTMTILSEGMRQKVLLIILLVVLFSALSGVNLDFRAQGHLGEFSPEKVGTQ
jgi:hypothetical protein